MTCVPRRYWNQYTPREPMSRRVAGVICSAHSDRREDQGPISAPNWGESSRCPRYSFSRCSPGVYPLRRPLKSLCQKYTFCMLISASNASNGTFVMLPPLVTNGLHPRACILLPYLIYRADHPTGRVSRFRQERAATELGMSAKTIGLALRDLEQARCVRVEGNSGEPLRVTKSCVMPLALAMGR